MSSSSKYKVFPRHVYFSLSFTLHHTTFFADSLTKYNHLFCTMYHLLQTVQFQTIFFHFASCNLLSEWVYFRISFILQHVTLASDRSILVIIYFLSRNHCSRCVYLRLTFVSHNESLAPNNSSSYNHYLSTMFHLFQTDFNLLFVLHYVTFDSSWSTLDYHLFYTI